VSIVTYPAHTPLFWLPPAPTLVVGENMLNCAPLWFQVPFCVVAGGVVIAAPFMTIVIPPGRLGPAPPLGALVVVTVTTHAPTIPLSLAVTVHVPAATGTTNPATAVATAVLLEAQTYVRPVSKLPLESVVEAESCTPALLPVPIDSCAWLRITLNGFDGTVTGLPAASQLFVGPPLWEYHCPVSIANAT
jgi:hypothetical protein